MDIKSFSPRTGRMIKEDGTTVNIADLLSKGSAAVSSGKFNIDSRAPMTGRMIREDGTVVNIAELIEQFVNSGGGSVTPEQIQEAVNNYLEQNPIQVAYTPPKKVLHGTADTTFTLPPNEEHEWGEVSDLNITFGPETEGVVNEFMFIFISGAAATRLTIPETVKGMPEIEPNSYYEISIKNNKVAYERWDI